jgi:hypothetical protein
MKRKQKAEEVLDELYPQFSRKRGSQEIRQAAAVIAAGVVVTLFVLAIALFMSLGVFRGA